MDGELLATTPIGQVGQVDARELMQPAIYQATARFVQDGIMSAESPAGAWIARVPPAWQSEVKRPGTNLATAPEPIHNRNEHIILLVPLRVGAPVTEWPRALGPAAQWPVGPGVNATPQFKETL